MRGFFSPMRKSFTQGHLDTPSGVRLLPRFSPYDSFFALDFIFNMQDQSSASFAYFLGRTIKSLSSWASQDHTTEMLTDLSTDLVDKLTKR
jgi:hypothetical protein